MPHRLSPFGIPLPFLLLYLVWFRWPSMKTLYICSAILGFFVALNFFGWSVRAICLRVISTFRERLPPVAPSGGTGILLKTTRLDWSLNPM